MIMSEGSTGEESKKKRGRPKGTKSKPKAETQTIETTKGKSKAEESESVLTAAEVAAIAEAQAKAAAARLAAARLAAEVEAEKEYEAAAAQVVVADPGNSFTHNRGAEQIFRREMGEPEFWLDKLGRAPKRTILSQDEEQQRLLRLRSDPNASAQEINQAEEDLKTLDYLYENYNIGMNVFRTAKGGRAKLRE